MAFTPNLEDRERDKFVESPTRPGFTAVEVVGSVSLEDSTMTNPSIQNQLLVLADTEYTISIPANTVCFHIRSREISRLQIAFNSGDTNSNYFSIPIGGVFNMIKKISSANIYVRSNRPNITLEMLFLTN